MVEATQGFVMESWSSVLCSASFREQDAGDHVAYAAVEMCRNRLAEFHSALNEAEKVVKDNTLLEVRRLKRVL